MKPRCRSPPRNRPRGLLVIHKIYTNQSQSQLNQGNRKVNKLTLQKRMHVLSMLVEGSSMRSISRTVKCSINTVTKLLIDAGKTCADFHDKTVRDVRSSRIECDEIWSFLYAKEKNVEKAKTPPPHAGSVWTWTALDPDTKLIVAFDAGNRDKKTCRRFINDLKARLHPNPDLHITTDEYTAYPWAIYGTFKSKVHHSTIKKTVEDGGIEVDKTIAIGAPNLDEAGTSHVERHNLTMRMGMRRYTRLTNGFSKKIENHRHMLSLFFVHYNFCRVHMTLETTPAIKAGLADVVYDFDWIVQMIEERAPKPNRPKKYKMPRIEFRR